jgi:hypothetical protein
MAFLRPADVALFRALLPAIASELHQSKRRCARSASPPPCRTSTARWRV